MNYNSDETDTVFTPEQVLENRGRVAIFIDGSNLFYAALQLGIEIDYTKLLCRLTSGSRLLRSFFYTGVDRTNEKQQGFLVMDASQRLSRYFERFGPTARWF